MKTLAMRIGSPLALSLLALVGALLLLGLGSDALAAPAQPDAIIHVATTGNDNPACGSAGSPCRTIQYALDRAGSGDEIRVAGGTYSGVNVRPAPPGYLGTTVVTQVVYINEPVTIRGGYSSDFSAWNPSAYPTIVDAQDQGRAAFISGNHAVTLEGLGFTYGNAAGMGGQLFNNDGGGGIYIMDATVVISACQIVDNVAQSGGGISMWNYCHVTIHNSTIQGNQSIYSGGGIMQVTGDLFLYHSNVLANSTNAAGGGIATLYGTAVLVGNVIEDNVANVNDGGGFFLSNSVSTTLLYNNVIAHNWAGARGDGLTLSQANAELLHNTIVGVGEGDGVAILNTSSITMVNTIIARNTVGVSVDAGGSVWMHTTL